VSEFLKLAAGAFFGVIVGLLVQWWKSHRDELRGLCDETCRTITEASDLASKYWLSSASNQECGLQEARLIGLQVRIDGYYVLLSRYFRLRRREQLSANLANFYDALTGGTFKDSSRLEDPDRAHAAQTEAARAILSVRNAFYETTSLRELGRRLEKLLTGSGD
jgi:hypothetical protein